METASEKLWTAEEGTKPEEIEGVHEVFAWFENLTEKSILPHLVISLHIIVGAL